ncbi:hypothetical protein LINPERPRIM_LOCUS26742 [Linum perenne]
MTASSNRFNDGCVPSPDSFSYPDLFRRTRPTSTFLRQASNQSSRASEQSSEVLKDDQLPRPDFCVEVLPLI